MDKKWQRMIKNTPEWSGTSKRFYIMVNQLMEKNMVKVFKQA